MNANLIRNVRNHRANFTTFYRGGRKGPPVAEQLMLSLANSTRAELAVGFWKMKLEASTTGFAIDPAAPN